jgi:serine/threonine protein phosphatase PrpC
METPLISSNAQWRVVGASVTGTGHQKIGRGCDDAHLCCISHTGSLLLAVADGAGSASRSAEGAGYVVQTALQTAETLLAQQPEPESVEQWHATLSFIWWAARTSLEVLAASQMSATESTLAPTTEEEGRPQLLQKPATASLREFATTLLLTIVTPRWIAVTQIGDGAVVAQYAGGELQVLTVPDHGEYVNESSFITDANYLEKVQYVVLPQNELQGIALFTDGLEMLALDYATKKAYQPFFLPLFKFAASSHATQQELAAFLASDRVCERTDDDKTIVLAVRL